MSAQGDEVVIDVARDIALAELEQGPVTPQEFADWKKSNQEEVGLASTKLEAVDSPAKRGGVSSYEAPSNSLELALIARRYVRSMIRVLVQIARDKTQSPAARVQAAKEIINRAVLEKSALDQIDDVRLKAMAEVLVAKIEAERQIELKRQKALTFDTKL